MGVKRLLDRLPRYRELNIMNRVLNKGFARKSYLNSALIAFSDVFRPASLMQSCKMCDPDGREFPVNLITNASNKKAHASHTRRI
jgi:hypothetical protein